MGGKTSRVTYDQWDLMALAQAIGISEADIHKYYQDFNKAAGKDGKISKSEFASFYKKFPGSQQQGSRDLKEQTARIFRTFDRDNSSSLSFEEFLGVIVMMNHDMPRKDRFDYLIRNNNPNGCQNKSQITADYGQEVFQTLDNYYGSSGVSAEQRWAEVDPYGQGIVSQQDLLDYVSQQDTYNQKYQYAGV